MDVRSSQISPNKSVIVPSAKPSLPQIHPHSFFSFHNPHHNGFVLKRHTSRSDNRNGSSDPRSTKNIQCVPKSVLLDQGNVPKLSPLQGSLFTKKQHIEYMCWKPTNAEDAAVCGQHHSNHVNSNMSKDINTGMCLRELLGHSRVVY